MLSLPDTPAADYIDAVHAAERLKDRYAEYFQHYDALLIPVLPVPSFKQNQTELQINGQTVSIMGIMSATSPLNVNGLPMRFGTSHDGMPIGIQSLVTGRQSPPFSASPRFWSRQVPYATCTPAFNPPR